MADLTAPLFALLGVGVAEAFALIRGRIEHRARQEDDWRVKGAAGVGDISVLLQGTHPDQVVANITTGDWAAVIEGVKVLSEKWPVVRKGLAELAAGHPNEQVSQVARELVPHSGGCTTATPF
jgi:hypothetical protein